VATDPSWLFNTVAVISSAFLVCVLGLSINTKRNQEKKKPNLQEELSNKKAQLKGLRHYMPPLIYKNRATPEELQSRKEHMESRQEKISSLGAEIRDLENRIEAFSYPSDLRFEIGVVTYITLFGIILPVLIIAYEVFYTWTKLITWISFSLGIMLFITYIYSYIMAHKEVL